MTQAFNSSSDPVMLSAEVFKLTQQDFCDWNSLGTPVMEISHCGREFTQVAEEAEQDFRDPLSIPSNYKVLFCHGGDRGQFAGIPLNILGNKATTDYIDAGYWVTSVVKEAKKCCTPNIIDVEVTADGLRAIKPTSEWQFSDNTAHLYYYPNGTIDGITVDETPNFASDIVVTADLSSTILSAPLGVSRYSIIYAGAQKDIGLTDLTIITVREDLLGKAHVLYPSILDYTVLNGNDSTFNTPSTSTWHLSGLASKWLKKQGGVNATDKVNQQKAESLYGVIDNSDFCRNDVAKPNRSRMSVPFQLTDNALDKLLLGESSAVGLYVLKRHRVVGGMCTSIYSTMPLEGARALTDFMVDSERCCG